MKRLVLVVMALGIIAAIWGGAGALAGYEAEYVRMNRGVR